MGDGRPLALGIASIRYLAARAQLGAQPFIGGPGGGEPLVGPPRLEAVAELKRDERAAARQGSPGPGQGGRRGVVVGGDDVDRAIVADHEFGVGGQEGPSRW